MSDFRNDRIIYLWIIVGSIVVSIFFGWYLVWQTKFSEFAKNTKSADGEQEIYMENVRNGIEQLKSSFAETLDDGTGITDFDANVWNTYQFEGSRFEMIYPSTYSIEELNGGVKFTDNDSDKYSFAKIDNLTQDYKTYIADNFQNKEGLSKDPEKQTISEKTYYKYLLLRDGKVFYIFTSQLDDSHAIQFETNDVQAVEDPESNIYLMLGKILNNSEIQE